jgi:hypothetical protein
MTFPRRLEPLTQRVRARIGKRIILDTTHAQPLFEDERHPWRAVPKDALLAPLAGPAAADNLGLLVGRRARRHAPRPGRPHLGHPAR